jgi:hypothetical protein
MHPFFFFFSCSISAEKLRVGQLCEVDLSQLAGWEPYDGSLCPSTFIMEHKGEMYAHLATGEAVHFDPERIFPARGPVANTVQFEPGDKVHVQYWHHDQPVQLWWKATILKQHKPNVYEVEWDVDYVKGEWPTRIDRRKNKMRFA